MSARIPCGEHARIGLCWPGSGVGICAAPVCERTYREFVLVGRLPLVGALT